LSVVVCKLILGMPCKEKPAILASMKHDSSS